MRLGRSRQKGRGGRGGRGGGGAGGGGGGGEGGAGAEWREGGGRKDVASVLQQEGEEVSCRNSEVEL